MFLLNATTSLCPITLRSLTCHGLQPHDPQASAMPLTLDGGETPMEQVSSKQSEKAWLKPVLSNLEWTFPEALGSNPSPPYSE